MFERFTERARQVVVLSQDEARHLRHNYIGTEHILLGLLREEEGLAAQVLDSFDITLDGVRVEVARIVGPGDDVTTGQIPFTPRAKKVLDGSLKEAVHLGHRQVRTEHILLGLARLDDGVAARVLRDLNADAEKIRGEAMRLIESPDYAKRVEADATSTAKREVVIKRSPPADDVANETLAQNIGELVTSSAETDEQAGLALAIESAVRAMTVGQFLDAVRYTKETYIEEQDFERAVTFRDIERNLLAAIRAIRAQGS